MVGIVTNGLAFGGYMALTTLRLEPELCALLIYALAAFIGYLANYRWTFASKALHRNALPKFLGAHLTGATCQFVIIAILYRELQIPHQVAQLTSLGAVSIVLFMLMKHIVFPESQTKP
jgi:putative flippase GtrA